MKITAVCATGNKRQNASWEILNATKHLFVNNMGAEHPKLKILLVCNAEHGQANIPLAIAHELLLRKDVEVHLCSFASLQKRFETQLQQYGREYGAQVEERAQFHKLRGPTVTEVFLRSGKRGPFHAAGISGCIAGLSNVFEDYWGWTESEYMAIFNSCAEVLARVEPTLIAIDYFFLPGRDAVQNQKRPYCLLNTTSLSHIVLGIQPYHAYLWKYPMVGTGYSYPLPPQLVPANALAAWKCTQTYRSSKQRRLLSQWRKNHAIKGRFPFADSWRPDRFHLSPSLPELDWPMQIPKNVIGCGPILLPVRPVGEQNPELHQWLSRGPTVLFNLGTLFAISTGNAGAIARSLRRTLQLDSQRKTQVLWKLQKHPDDDEDVFAEVTSILQPFIDEGRVRILSWLDVEPLALLQTGHIICSVHHGGANSWFEAVQTGVPQVVLPAWQDCYENAARAEWLQIGLHANKSSAPNVNEDELTKAISAVLGVDTFRKNATELARKISRRSGRVEAAELLVDIAVGKLKAEDAIIQDAITSSCSSKASAIQEVCNKEGGVLATISATAPWTFPGYHVLQDIVMAIHVLSMWWMPVLAVLMLFIPQLRIPWLICMSYSLLTARHHEKSTFPLYYHLIRRTRIWDIYRSFYSDYYPVHLYRTSELSPTRKYIFGYHPHGVGIRGMGICFGMQAAGFPQLFPGLRTTFHVTSAAFKVPLWKSHLQLMGCKSVSRAGCEAQLTTGGHDDRGMGNGIIISVGGHREAKRARPNSMDVVAKMRKGFIRLSVETGAVIVPVIGFGENDVFEEPVHKGTFGERIWKSLSHMPPDVKGEVRRFSIGMPFRKPLHVVVGSPITVEQQDTPDADYVNKLQGLYIQQLEQIWHEWRDHFGIDRSVEFRIVD